VAKQDRMTGGRRHRRGVEKCVFVCLVVAQEESQNKMATPSKREEKRGRRKSMARAAKAHHKQSQAGTSKTRQE
jgi:hypothetical protein